jgi:hypothetical protein
MNPFAGGRGRGKAVRDTQQREGEGGPGPGDEGASLIVKGKAKDIRDGRSSSSSSSSYGLRQVYRVEEGDTLWKISEDMSVPLEDLLRANKGSSCIKPGDHFSRRIGIGPKSVNLSDLGARFSHRTGRRGGGGGTRETTEREASTSTSTDPPRSFWNNSFRLTSTAEEFRLNDSRVRLLLYAMRCVETSNCPLPAPAGDNGTSIGPLQISHAYHNDAWGLGPNQKGSHEHWMKHCQGVEYSERTCLKYWMRWCPWALQFGDVEALARTHNGGPQYERAFKTARYWRKIKGEMNAYNFASNPHLRIWRNKRKAEDDYGHYVPWECRKVFEFQDICSF